MLPPIAGDLTVSELELPTILATIRQTESGGNYTAQAKGATASGAYQYLDSTWAGYGGFTRAKDAPPEVQDARAAEDVRRILAANNGSAAAVFASWYWPISLRDPSQLDIVPMPGAGNKHTVRSYVELQLGRLTTNLGSRWGSLAPGPVGAAVDAAGAVGDVLGWAGDKTAEAVAAVMGTVIDAIGKASLIAVLIAGGVALVALGSRKVVDQ
jgi:hypothetical protein